jgi:hypothetical protein
MFVVHDPKVPTAFPELQSIAQQRLADILWARMRLVGAPMRWADASGCFAKRGSVGHRNAHSS